MAFVFDTAGGDVVSARMFGFDSDAIADGTDVGIDLGINVGGATDGSGAAVVRGVAGAGSVRVGGDEQAANALKKTRRRTEKTFSWP